MAAFRLFTNEELEAINTGKTGQPAFVMVPRPYVAGLEAFAHPFADDWNDPSMDVYDDLGEDHGCL